jgi:hypothetical protein
MTRGFVHCFRLRPRAASKENPLAPVLFGMLLVAALGRDVDILKRLHCGLV